MAVKESLQVFLNEHDMTPADVPPFLFIHTALSAILVGSTWYLFYIAAGSITPQHPSKFSPGWKMPDPSLSAASPPKSILLNTVFSSTIFPTKFRQRTFQALVSVENKAKSSKAVQYLEQKFPSLDATRLTISYAEAKFARLFFKPITVPGRIWLSWKGTTAWRKFRDAINDVQLKESQGDGGDLVASSRVSVGQNFHRMGSNVAYPSHGRSNRLCRNRGVSSDSCALSMRTRMSCP